MAQEESKRDYAAAAQMLAPGIKNKTLALNLIGRSELPYWRGKIMELMKVEAQRESKGNPSATQVKTPASTGKTVTPKMEVVYKGLMTAEQFEAAPDEVKALEGERKKLLQQRTQVKEGIEGAASDQLRKEMAQTVVEIGERVDEIDIAIKYYLANGKLPESKDGGEKTMTLAEVIARIPQVRSMISKAKNAVDSAKDEAKKAKASEKLAQREAELEDLVQLKAKLEATA